MEDVQDNHERIDPAFFSWIVSGQRHAWFSPCLRRHASLVAEKLRQVKANWFFSNSGAPCPSCWSTKSTTIADPYPSCRAPLSVSILHPYSLSHPPIHIKTKLLFGISFAQSRARIGAAVAKGMALRALGTSAMGVSKVFLRHIAPALYGDQDLASGPHFSAGHAQWRHANAA